ncbi:type IX secretion system protein PorD [Flavobacterium sp. U410]|jgi:hypothetical protein
MRNVLAILFLVFNFAVSSAQELNATVSVNYERMTDVNPQIFKNLETKVREFLNNTRFTDLDFKQHEKIECNFYINVAEFNSNNIQATLQVQSSRPIYNSSYSSPVLNINDKDVGFRFLEYEQLVYDQNNFTSNLISVLAFYANIIIAVDRETFEENGGTKYLQSALTIMNFAQPQGYKGWSQNENTNTNRYFLITDIMSNTYSAYRKAMYEYHAKGLDIMESNPAKAKEEIEKSIETLSAIQKYRPNAFLTRVFFDAKVDEVVAIFSGGPTYNTVPLRETLDRISPLNSAKWNRIR